MTTIVAIVVVGAVAIVLAVGFVVLFVVAEQIRQRETVVDGDMIDASARRPSVVIERVGRAGHSRTDVADQMSFTGPITS